MSIDKLKLAAYLDEAGEEPASACAAVVKAGISYVVIRQTPDMTDPACQRLKKLLSEHGLSAVALVTDLGKVEPKLLPRTSKEQLDRSFAIANYFQCSMIRMFCGLRTKEPSAESITTWMRLITERSLQANLVPLLEVTEDAATVQAAEIAQMLVVHKRWKLLYDPVHLILRQNQNPFEKYWTLLKSSVAAIDVRDFKIGHGYKPPGFGDARMKLTIDDALKSGYNGWCFLEPSLGRKYSDATTRSETFALAVEALDVMLT